MKQRLQALGVAATVFVLAQIPFAIAYALMASTLFWSHGQSRGTEQALSLFWAVLGTVLPLWAAWAAYRKIRRGRLADGPAP